MWTRMGTADWTNEKLSSFYWEDQHWHARIHRGLWGFAYCSQKAKRLCDSSPLKQLEFKLKFKLSRLQILIRALRYDIIIFTQYPFGNDTWMFFCATSPWTQAFFKSQHTGFRLRNKEAPFIPLYLTFTGDPFIIFPSSHTAFHLPSGSSI